MNDLVSIIVPVYNCELYLKQCLDSIQNQTYRNIEVIIVNDGSTDKSLEIINSYHDRRFKVFSIERRSVGYVRNIGLSKASGSYIMFVDADDVVKDTFVEKMLKGIIGYDLCVCYFSYFENAPKFNNVDLHGELMLDFNS